MAAKKKLDKKDHAAMGNAAKAVKGVVTVGVLILSIIPGVKYLGLDKLIKKF